MDKIIRLYNYIDNVTETPFPEGERQVECYDFTYSAERMGEAPTITAEVMYERCLDDDFNEDVFCWFNGERYFLDRIPSSSYSNEDARYKHNLEFKSERIVLENVYFMNTVIAGDNDLRDYPVTNNTKFVFFGGIRELATRLQQSLEYSGIGITNNGVGYSIVVDDDVTTTEEKFIDVDNLKIKEILDRINDVWEVPYYFISKDIHIGYSNAALIPEDVTIPTFEYGFDKHLLNIQRTNENNEIVNRITGYGSSENIPYYYPNNCPLGLVFHYIAAYDEFTNQNYSEIPDAVEIFEDTLLRNWQPSTVMPDNTIQYGTHLRYDNVDNNAGISTDSVWTVGRLTTRHPIWISRGNYSGIRQIEYTGYDNSNLVVSYFTMGIAPGRGVVPSTTATTISAGHDNYTTKRQVFTITLYQTPKARNISCIRDIEVFDQEKLDLLRWWMNHPYGNIYDGIINSQHNIGAQPWDDWGDAVSFDFNRFVKYRLKATYARVGNYTSAYAFFVGNGNEALDAQLTSIDQQTIFDSGSLTLSDFELWLQQENAYQAHRPLNLVSINFANDTQQWESRIKLELTIDFEKGLDFRSFADNLNYSTGYAYNFMSGSDFESVFLKPFFKLKFKQYSVDQMWNKIVFDETTSQTLTIPTALGSFGLRLSNTMQEYYYPQIGDEIYATNEGFMEYIATLMPSIYRNTLGDELWYNAINGTYRIPNSFPPQNYQFTNLYKPHYAKEHIEEFEDIKPTIKEMKNSQNKRIDMFIEFAYDITDSDHVNTNNEYEHPYFYAKMRKTDVSNGYGFNLFKCGSQSGNMTFEFTTGVCGACKFELQVTGNVNNGYKNPVPVYQYDVYDNNTNQLLHHAGDLIRDNLGNILYTGGETIQSQQDTENNEVWLCFKKEESTFGTLMPSKTDVQECRPNGAGAGNNGDTFIITNINLPFAYVLAAEQKLEDKLLKYMNEHNRQLFNYTIDFSRIYYELNYDAMDNYVNETSKVKVRYNQKVVEYYAQSYTYQMDSSAPLPHVTITLNEETKKKKNALDIIVDRTTDRIDRIESVQSEKTNDLNRLDRTIEDRANRITQEISQRVAATERGITTEAIIEKTSLYFEPVNYLKNGDFSSDYGTFTWDEKNAVNDTLKCATATLDIKHNSIKSCKSEVCDDEDLTIILDVKTNVENVGIFSIVADFCNCEGKIISSATFETDMPTYTDTLAFHVHTPKGCELLTFTIIADIKDKELYTLTISRAMILKGIYTQDEKVGVSYASASVPKEYVKSEADKEYDALNYLKRTLSTINGQSLIYGGDIEIVGGGGGGSIVGSDWELVKKEDGSLKLVYIGKNKANEI